MKRLLFLFLVGWTIAAACIGCRTSRPAPERDVSRAEGTPLARPDSSSRDNHTPPEGPMTEPSKQGLIAKIWPFKQDLKKTSEVRYFLNPTKPPRKCKGCTIINAAPGATVTTNTAAKNATAGTGATGGGKAGAPVAGAGAELTSIEKAKAPVSTGTGDATDQSGTGAASTIKGNNNAPVLTNAPVEAPDWKAQLAAGFATPVGKGLALLLLAGAGYGVYRLWPLLRRKSSDPQS